MDALLAIFLSWQFMIFCLGLSAMGFVLRKLIEYFILDNPHLPGNKRSMIWRSLILPIAPVVSGAVAAYLAKGYPYPEGLGTSEYGRVSFGLVAGLLSGLVYRVISEILRSKMSQGYAQGYSQPDQFNNPIGIVNQPVQDVTQNIQVSVNKEPVVPIGMNGQPLVTVSTSQDPAKSSDIADK
jgi:hypothetical protein